jgi:hypothetical protein
MYFFILFFYKLKFTFYCIKNIVTCLFVWGLGIGDWGLAQAPNPQSPIPNPQSPIPNPQSPFNFCKFLTKTFKNKIVTNKIS